MKSDSIYDKEINHMENLIKYLEEGLLRNI